MIESIRYNDEKVINKLSRNADPYYVNSELVNLETTNLLMSSQSGQRISLTPIDSLSNFKDTPALGANKTPQLQGGHINPHHLYIKIF